MKKDQRKKREEIWRRVLGAGEELREVGHLWTCFISDSQIEEGYVAQSPWGGARDGAWHGLEIHILNIIV